MPLPIQLGELANRVRRALDTRGRLPLALDETVVPVVLIADADEVPYALDPIHAAGFQRGTGAAAAQCTIGISNQGPEGSVFILEQLAIACGTANAEIEISRSGTLTADVPASSRVMADLTSQARPGAVGRDVPVRLDLHTATTITTVGSICEMIRTGPDRSLILPVKHYLRRGEVCFVKCSAVNQLLSVGASGRYFLKISDTGA
jgi:hypothetical protein